MIEYFNENQGFAMVMLTAVYVIATVVLVVVSQRQARLAKKSLEFAAQAENARRRPHLVFDIVYEQIVAYAKIRNVGASPAINVQIKVKPNLKWKDKDHGIGFIEDGIAFFAPGRELSQPFGWMKEFREQYPDLEFSGTVEYSDRERNSYQEEFHIDLNYIKKESYIGEPDQAQEIKKIRESIEKIVNGSFKPIVRTISESDYQNQQKEMRESAEKRLNDLNVDKKK